MPYKLRKAPKSNLYWVVGEDGKHFSKEPMPKEQAKAQLRALYVNEKKGGGIWESLFDAYNEYVGIPTWNFVRGVGDLDSEFWVQQKPPAEVEKFLASHSDTPIWMLKVRRAPVQKALEYALDLFSAGQWSTAKEKLGYDAMFHLSIVLNANTVVEKLARVNVGPVDEVENAEMTGVTVTRQTTLGQMWEKAKKHMGSKFYPYDPFNNNCQDFVNGFLEANKDVLDYTKEKKEFVLQDAKSMVADLPTYMPAFARTITSLGGLTGGGWREEAPEISAPELLEMVKQGYLYVGKGEYPAPIFGDFTLVESTPELLLYKYKESTNYILVVRGTKETRDILSWTPLLTNSLKDTTRMKNDLFIVRNWRDKHKGNWFGTGHSLGGAILDNLMREGHVLYSVTFNPAIQPQDFVSEKTQRIYFQGDPLLTLFGVHDPKHVVVGDAEPGWFSWLPSFSSHGINNFEGQLDDVLLGGSYAPKFLYETAENVGRPAHERRTLREQELGLRALAHLEEKDNPLASFGARVMADDLYEFNTGESIDWEHSKYAQDKLKDAFRSSRPDQVRRLREVNATIAKYNLPNTREGRATAYRILTGEEEPPKAPEPVKKIKSPAEVRAEAERAEKARKEAEEEELKRKVMEEEKALRKAEEEKRIAIEAEKKLVEEMARKKEEEDRLRKEEAVRKLAELEEKREEAEAEAKKREAEMKLAQAEEARAKAMKPKQVKKGKKVVEEVDEDDVLFANQELLNAIDNNILPLQHAKKMLAMRKKKNERELRWYETSREKALNPEETKSEAAILWSAVADAKSLKRYEGLLGPEYRLSLSLSDMRSILKQLRKGEHQEALVRNMNDPMLGDVIGIDETSIPKFEEYMNVLLKQQDDEQEKRRAEVPEIERRILDYKERILKVENEDKEYDLLIQQLEDRKAAMTKQFEEEEKGRRKKGKGLGFGRQHKDFVYSRPGLTIAEKAKERAAHYRKVKQAEKKSTVKVKGAPRTTARFTKEGKELPRTSPEFATGESRTVVLTEEEKKREEARGKKEKVPKKDSVRKPYVGKVMKQKFMEKAKGRDEKEVRNLFNKAKRLYKQGGQTWEQVTQSVL